MKRSSEKFSDAIRRSIKHLEDSGVSITQKAVIDNALFDNGRHVGKSTLYRKDPVTKEHFYKGLLAEIDNAASRQRRFRGRPTKKETVIELKGVIRELKRENQALVDQVVTQEAELIKLKSLKRSDLGVAKAKDDDIYVLAKILLGKTSGSHESLDSIVRRYEIVHKGTERLKESQAAAEKLRQELSGATVSLPGMRK
ncbi:MULTISPECIES: hypothetical protein [Halomonadaceae]|uniref:Uncharacterized protein n=1 Tax=Modicisalibacter ilicicola DSM 19980 TaxID=1121942 RepID=A0A1M5DH57_9GAMM|nr:MULTISPECIES: hypothetical protein [Halomonas]SHF66241.1 hypothetical protein SAMN02745148_03237 [Halomonas ilicicola DSM 19980]